MINRKHITALLIEDNRGDARLIREVLLRAEEVRFTLAHAETLQDGLSQLKAEAFDVILLDLSLPDSYGLDTVTRIHNAADQLAIVVLTGDSDHSLGMEAVKAGAQDYLVKGETDARLLVRSVRYAIERKRYQYEAREYAALQERQRLARELHDSVSQTLFTASAMAESAVRQFNTRPERAHDLIKQVHALSVEALAEMRVLLLELRPDSLMQVGLQRLFEQYLRPIQNRRRFEVAFNVPDGLEVPPAVQMALYRIVQEALNNIDKHAQARHVEVSVSPQVGGLTLMIVDDGIGFDADSIAPTSLGLSMMRERASEIGASIRIVTAPRKGTQIIVQWPE